MATDYWPSEEREIVPGLSIGFAYCELAVAEGAAVKVGTPAASQVRVTTAAAKGDGIAIALKAGAAGATIPVAWSGVIKVVVDGNSGNVANIAMGDFLINSAEYGCVKAQVDVIGRLKLFGGSSYILGMALHASTVLGDEILMVLGKCI